jgi:hypothetical protein
VKRPLKPGVFGSAQFVESDGVRVARLRLDRWWDPDAIGDRFRPLVVIGMNPSDACEAFDDPTIGNVCEFGRRAGANGIVMVNVTPEITKFPHELGTKLMPDGTDEQQWAAIAAAMKENAVHVLAAWGKWPRNLSSWHDRLAKTCAIAKATGRDLMCLGTNKDGSPRHPSRLAYSTPIVPWKRAA